jgi:N-acyl-D-aspartate/D-glutamate deacylase
VLHRPECPNLVRQGVTTIVAGNCGGSPLPIGEHLRRVEAQGVAVNYATLIGHGTVRTAVMESRGGEPSAAELAQMRDLVARAMQEGAIGLSTGLWYVPGAYAKAEEVVECAKVAAERGGVYASHIRGEGPTAVEGVNEAIEIGASAGLPVEISHLKRWGVDLHGTAEAVLEPIEEARRRGLDVNADAYPYEASATGLGVLIPRDMFEGGKLEQRLEDPGHRATIGAYMEARLAAVGGPGRILITSSQVEPRLNGRRLADAPALMGKPLEECVLDLVVGGSVSAVYFAMDPRDVETILRNPNVMVASDSGVRAPEDGYCHPRNYGCFPRFLRLFVRETAALTLEEGVRKMTDMPARKFRLQGRGLVAPGHYADLVIFDPDTITDRATYETPWQYAEGVRWVIVNGRIALTPEADHIARAGRVLRPAATAA